MGNQTHTYAGHWNGHICDQIYLNKNKPIIIAGPCMLESYELGIEVGSFLKRICDKYQLQYVFKSSYDKANRTSVTSKRGPGLEKGLQWLTDIKEKLNVPILTDVHSIAQIQSAGKIVDILQIPAFLCKQRELLCAAAETGKVVQIKKGQWAAPEEMLEIAQYIASCNNQKVILVERGSCFGYNNLVVDFRNLVAMAKEGHAVIFDATHAVQLPGAGNGTSSGLREMVHPLAKAAVAIGVDGIFMEVHPNPRQALSDADTQLDMASAEKIIQDIARLSLV